MMQEHNLDTVRRANMMMMLGIKSERRISDNFSDEEIERAWRKAYEKVGDFVMPKDSHETL